MKITKFFKARNIRNLDDKNYNFSNLSTSYILVGMFFVYQIVLTPFYLETFGKVKFGYLAILLSITQYIGLATTSVGGYLNRVFGLSWAKKNIQEINDIFLASKYIIILYLLIFSTFILVISKILSISFLDESSILLLSFLIYVFILFETLPERHLYFATNHQTQFHILEILRLSISLVLILKIVPLYPSISNIFLINAFTYFLFRIYSINFWHNIIFSTIPKLNFKNHISWIKKILRRKNFLYLFQSVLNLLLISDVLIVSFLAGPSIAGLYALAAKMPDALHQLLSRIPTSQEPRIINLSHKEGNKKLLKLFYKGFLLYVPLCFLVSLAFYIAGPYIFDLWIRGREVIPEKVFLFSSFSLFFISIARWHMSFLYSLYELKTLIKITILEFILKTFFTIFIFKYLGYSSPFVSGFITHLFLISWYYFSETRKAVIKISSK